MNIAAYIAWAAIGTEIWLREPNSTGLVPEALLQLVVILLHLLFLLIFVACTVFEKNRLRMQTLAFLLVLVALGICMIARFSSAPILLIVASSVIASLLSPVRLAAVFVLSNICLYFIYQHLWQIVNPLVSVFIYSSFQMFAMLMAWYSKQAEQRRDALVAINAELLGTRTLLDASVRDSERLRISRELHDVAGHKLTALKLNLKAMQREPGFANSTALQLATDLSDELLQDIRAVVQQLRLHDGLPLRDALQALATPFPQLTLSMQLHEASSRLSMAEAEAILRCVQEALTNAVKHADARQLQVRLQQTTVLWQLDISDDGTNTPQIQQGNGLNGMRERIENLGGSLQWQCVRGMPLSAQWPVRE